MTRAPRQALIPLDDHASWNSALEGIPHAFAHTWASNRAMHLTTGWPTYLYVWEDGGSRVVCPIAERELCGFVDVVTPYGFGGFVGAGAESTFLPHWAEIARERGYVCGYLGLNPLLSPSVFRQSPEYGEHNEVFVLHLDRGLDELYRDLSTNRRRQVRALDGGAVQLVEERRRLDAFFLDHVDEFLRASGATSTYSFSAATWHALLEHEHAVVLGVEDHDANVTAASVFTHTPYCAEYLFGISTARGRNWSAALIWASAARLAEKGVPRLNLGGGVRRGDGIAEFKGRFGGTRLPLGALKQVYRPDVYAELCRRAGADPSDLTGFFPPYRAPDLTPIPPSAGTDTGAT